MNIEWEAPLHFAELTEKRLITAILENQFPINATLPGERELARQLGVTRSTLREALQRLQRDGWVDIQQGKPTRVRNYWQEGNLGVLAAIAEHRQHVPLDFVSNLLVVRTLLAPAYTRLAFEGGVQPLVLLLESYQNLVDTPEVFAAADWDLHHTLTLASGNPVFTLILNGFRDLYPAMGRMYFSAPAGRDSSRRFYAALLACAQAQDAAGAEVLTRRVMEESLNIWQTAVQQDSP